ncbi:hypothetical protein PENTCL1PPCAC_4921, partial [Pristionchus entomophagus]
QFHLAQRENGHIPSIHIPKAYINYRLDDTFIGKSTRNLVRKFDAPDGSSSIIVKKFYKPFDDVDRAKLTLRELNLLRTLRHPNVVRMVDKYTTDEKEAQLEAIYHITLHCGVPLSTIISEGCYTMARVKRWTRDLLSALQYINSIEVAHRNLNPDSMCISAANDQLTLLGFGKARVLNRAEINTQGRGKDAYMALEMRVDWNDVYDESVDMWSVGVILCEMLTGKKLFDCAAKNTKNIIQLFLKYCGPVPEVVYSKMTNQLDRSQYAKFEALGGQRQDFIQILKDKAGGSNMIGKDAIANEAHLKDFLDHTVQYDRKDRMSAAKALAHPFLSEVADPPKEENLFNAAIEACRSHVWRELHTSLAP